MIEVTGVIVGTLLLRRFRSGTGLLRAAVLAQIADLTTFASVWRNTADDRNPLVNLVHGTLVALTPGMYSVFVEWLAALVLIGLKTALIAYLVWAAPKLGRYRQGVLVLATAAGLVGALSNFRVFGIFIGPYNVPLLG